MQEPNIYLSKTSNYQSSLISKHKLFKRRTTSYTECENHIEILIFFGLHKSAKEIEVMMTVNEYLQCAEHCS